MKLLFSTAFLILGACTTTPRHDEPIARVNGEAITVGDYLSLFDTLKPKDLGLSGKERVQIKNLVIKTLIRRQVVLTEAHRKNVKLSDEELESGLKKFKEGYTTGAFEQSLLEQMVDEANWKERVRQTLLIEKLFESSKPQIPDPTDEEAHLFYERNRKLFSKNAMAQALQIVVRDEEKAKEIRKQLKASPKDFLKLAKENSIGPEAEKDAMITIEKDTMPDELDKPLFEGKLNEISPVLQSPYGFHILKVLKRTPSLNLDYFQVRAQISERLRQERRREWILKFEERLIRSAQIEYNRPLIERL